MSKRSVKLLQLLVVCVFTASILMACGTSNSDVNLSTEKETTKASTTVPSQEVKKLDQVTLKFYFPSDKPSAFDEVWNAISEKTKDTLNVKFEINFVNWNDIANKLMLLTSSGDDFDGFFTANWFNYGQMVNKGALLDLTELLKKYAPKLNARYDEVGYKKAISVGGKVYALPWISDKSRRPYVIYRSDLAKKYNIDLSNAKTLEDLEPYLEAVKKNEPKIVPFESSGLVSSNSTSTMSWGCQATKYELYNVTAGMVYDLNDPKCTIKPYEQTPAFREVAQLMRRWYEKGYTPKQTSSTVLDPWSGQIAAWTHELDSVLANIQFKGVPGAEKSGYALYPDKKSYNDSPLGNVFVLNKNAANPERTMMFIELLSTDREIYDMVQNGILGKTYELDGEKVKLPAGVDPAKPNYLNWCGCWAFWRSEFIRPDDLRGTEYYQKMKDATKEKNQVYPVLGSFFPSTEIVKTEIAKRDAIASDLGKIIGMGLRADVDKAVDEYIQKQKDAGVEKIVTELQKQIDTFIATK